MESQYGPFCVWLLSLICESQPYCCVQLWIIHSHCCKVFCYWCAFEWFLLWTVLLWTFQHMSFGEHIYVYAFLLGSAWFQVGVELLGSRASTLGDTTRQCVYQLHLYQQRLSIPVVIALVFYPSSNTQDLQSRYSWKCLTEEYHPDHSFFQTLYSTHTSILAHITANLHFFSRLWAL